MVNSQPQVGWYSGWHTHRLRRMAVGANRIGMVFS
jgi:hypothetical protein